LYDIAVVVIVVEGVIEWLEVELKFELKLPLFDALEVDSEPKMEKKIKIYNFIIKLS